MSPGEQRGSRLPRSPQACAGVVTAACPRLASPRCTLTRSPARVSPAYHTCPSPALPVVALHVGRMRAVPAPERATARRTGYLPDATLAWKAGELLCANETCRNLWQFGPDPASGRDSANIPSQRAFELNTSAFALVRGLRAGFFSQSSHARILWMCVSSERPSWFSHHASSTYLLAGYASPSTLQSEVASCR